RPRKVALLIGELAQVGPETCNPGGLLEQDRKKCVLWSIRSQLLAQHRGSAADRGQRVVQLVRDACRHRSERGEPPRAQDLVLRCAQLEGAAVDALLKLGSPAADPLAAPLNLASHGCESIAQPAQLAAGILPG